MERRESETHCAGNVFVRFPTDSLLPFTTPFFFFIREIQTKLYIYTPNNGRIVNLLTVLFGLTCRQMKLVLRHAEDIPYTEWGLYYNSHPKIDDNKEILFLYCFLLLFPSFLSLSLLFWCFLSRSPHLPRVSTAENVFNQPSEPFLWWRVLCLGAWSNPTSHK